MIWKIWMKCEMIWKIWKKSEKIWKLWKKAKLNSEKIRKIEKQIVKNVEERQVEM
jgi:hypothetical protein